ncbi:M23 family metallopeptidase [Phenylobacterium sp.]|uniref:M23 family metallopeptidase n=1 Tax=Phenylobacterium sp. TaxID=1871053 RepID=UPI002730B9D4|nr:M23 family metallopeptidase [Phenylobacterium sp.]MDP1872962.1 M23 family metallopeptidase [Phenylobacterium sp.]
MSLSDLIAPRMDARFLAPRLFALTAATMAATMATSAVADASIGLAARLSQVSVGPMLNAPATLPTPVVRELQWEGQDIDGDGQPDFVNPTGQAPRTHDAYGSGAYGASRDGGVRAHEGVDYAATAGQVVVAPISGYVTKIGHAYSSDTSLQFVEITNPALGYEARVFYIKPGVREGQAVRLGAPIGTARGLQDKYPGGMTDHVHLELAKAKSRFDATEVLVARYVAVETAAD